MFTEVDYHDAFVLTAKKSRGSGGEVWKRRSGSGDLRPLHQRGSICDEEAGRRPSEPETLCFNNRESGIEESLGVNASPNTIDELLSTEVILVVGFNNSQVMRVKLSQAAKNGAKVDPD